jgi:hypothetical protein
MVSAPAPPSMMSPFAVPVSTSLPTPPISTAATVTVTDPVAAADPSEMP